MVESSKILTVSYGTFSCTLEGFEDSFSTMKAIAEYFRDLAADDRYFGAEPPTPDAEMLTRIAEREIERRVEVRTGENGIVLRAAEPAREEAAPAMPPQPKRPVMAPAISSAAASEEPAANEAAAPVAEDDEDMAPEAETQADDTPETEVETLAEADADADEALTFADIAANPQPVTQPDPSSVAAKLARIRDVVGQSDAMPEAEFAEDTETAGMPDITDAFDDIEAMAEDQAGAEGADDMAEAIEEPTTEVEDDVAEIEEIEEIVAVDDAAFEEDAQDADTFEAVQIEADDAPHAATEVAQDDTPEAALAEAETDLAEDDDFGLEEEAVAEDQAAYEDEDEVDTTDDQISAVLRNLERAGATVPDDVKITPLAAAADADEAIADDFEEEMFEDEADTAFEDEDEAEVAFDDASEDTAEADEDEAPLMLSELVRASDEDDLDMAEADLPVTDDEAMAEPVAEEEEATTLRARILRVAKRVVPASDLAHDAESDPEAIREADANDSYGAIAAEIDGPRDDDADLDIEDVANVEHAAVAEFDEDEDFADDLSSDSLAALDGVDELITDFEDVVPTLSDDDEADLQAELADLSADEDEDHFEDDAVAEVEEEPAAIADNEAEEATADEGHHGRSILPDNDDEAMSRIMDHVDEELSNPESSRRRNAIAQLKAAVAATEAARRLGEGDRETAETEDAFRQDLDQVVRPRRAARPTSEARTERPRPAPLKLVASQRVDAETTRADGKDVAPVRPRRVAAATTTVAQTDAAGFAEFAADMGATDLPDLLEAAAAYTAFVEGAEDFSRPQIMKKVQASTEESFSREDGLRSFGTLLRQGRISKVSNGRFQVSDQTRFKPEKMAG